MKKTHWKKLVNKDYLGAYSLDEGQELEVTIKTVRSGQVKNENGTQTKILLFFKEPVGGQNKPYILNMTNAKRLDAAFGHYIENWVGKKVTLYVQEGVRAFGTTTDAIWLRVPNQKKANKKSESAEKRALKFISDATDAQALAAAMESLVIEGGRFANNKEIVEAYKAKMIEL